MTNRPIGLEQVWKPQDTVADSSPSKNAHVKFIRTHATKSSVGDYEAHKDSDSIVQMITPNVKRSHDSSADKIRYLRLLWRSFLMLC